jgi:hypothetical protein
MEVMAETCQWLALEVSSLADVAANAQACKRLLLAYAACWFVMHP